MKIDIVGMKECHLPGILDLLELTFSGVSKNNYFSEEFIRWKHFDNPHGKSKILVATTKSNQVVGFRAFMPWIFKNVNNEHFFCYRPVDSAIHPEFRSYGLFKKLTFKMLDDEDVAGKDFIFNNPNGNSLPIYTKETWGWMIDSKVKFSVYPNIYKLGVVFNDKVSSNLDAKKKLETILLNEEYTSLIPGTFVDNRYIVWRYLNNPAVDYFFYSIDDICFFVFRLEIRGFLRELRMMDILCPINHVVKNDNNLKMRCLSSDLAVKFNYLLVSRDLESFVNVKETFKVSPYKPYINIVTRGLDRKMEDIGINLSMRDLELF